MGAPKDDDSLDAKRQWCIDPDNSVVVTACAGSGKTWLLTSRILRIILNDPECKQLHRILAITFTNNAAAEIEKRVRERLRELAYADEEKREKLLKKIGEDPEKHRDIAGIYRTFITKRPTLSVFTFHSWFTHLIQYLPWEARSSFHTRVADSPERLKQRAWEQMLENIKDDKSDEAKAMRYLLGLHKLRALQESLADIIDKRAEWYLYFGFSPEDDNAYSTFQEKNKKPKEECTKQELLESEEFKGMLADLEELGKKIDSSRLKTACKNINDARQNGADSFFQMVCKQIIKNSTARCKDTDGTGRTKEIISKLEIVKATHNYIYNKHCARIGTIYAQQYAKLKEQEGVIDYADMELIPLRALIKGTGGKATGEVCSKALQDLFERLDNNYDHILVDEFQDTNPVQWLMLHAWLEKSKGGNPLKVFIVGDPKQSIFSWRGGNPKLLGVARKYLKENYEGGAVSINHTRRCSQEIVDAVNEVFSNEGEWALDSFATHEVDTEGKEEKQNDGGSLVLCFQPKELPSDEKPEAKLRDPLDPEQEQEESNASLEGEVLADKIGEIKAKGYANKDIMLLHPTRTDSEFLIETLAGKGLSCSLLDKSTRMDCLECQDILALLHAIFDPGYGLMVAQVLRSPIFGVSEDDLWKVYQAGLSDEGKGCSWAKGLKQVKDGSGNLKEAQKMLRTWRKSYLNQKLPAHELLAQCYAHCYKDANLIERYVKAVPEEIAKRVVLNLDWILNYSLEAQGGRLVLPSEYAAHLRELSEASEATDLANEGDNVMPSLTVHGAKGLESKVVIVVNSDYRTQNSGNNLLVTWDLGKLRPSHLSFYRNKDSATDSQKQAWEELKEARKQEQNNLLYVAMTRAQQHLFISKRPASNRGGGTPSKWWDRINDCLGKPDEKGLDSLKPMEESSSAKETGKDQHREWLEKNPKSIRVGKQNEADNESKIKGTQRHNLLALILQNEETHEKVMDDNQLLHRRLLGIGKGRLKELHGEIKKILAPETEFGKLLAQVDKKKNPIECELSAIVDGEHKDQVKIRRIDCLLTTKDDVVWIIDFKTGGSAFEDEHKNEYDEQLRAYHSVVKGSHLKDKTIKMAIVDREGGMREVQPA